MYSIKVESHFSAAHNLREYKGKCEELHGHNWKVEVTVGAQTLDAGGMVVDFTLVKAELRKVMEVLDHTYINNIPYFKEVNPTSENIAKYIFDDLKARVPGLRFVTVWESERSSATYDES
jgi:6-pyruvoyltetrahydropterin/6-carboxytetrahydropterin synthase